MMFSVVMGEIGTNGENHIHTWHLVVLEPITTIGGEGGVVLKA